MKVKCYSIYEQKKQLLSEYANPPQKQFLDFELQSVLKSLKPSSKVEFQNTPNGVWYIRLCPNHSSLTQVMLASKEASSISMASNFLNQATQIQDKYDINKNKQKLRLKVLELLKVFNANKKVDALSSNVMELQEMMKGNVNKMVNNMTELQTAERKSQIMSELSIQFEKDAKDLQSKMKRRRLCLKLAIGAIVAFVLAIVIYILFL